MTEPDPKLPWEAGMGAAVDQARQEFVEMVDALVRVAGERFRPRDPLAFPSTAMFVHRGLTQLYSDPEVQLWMAVNMLTEATMRLVEAEQAK